MLEEGRRGLNWTQFGRNLEVGQALLQQLNEPGQVGLAAVSHCQQLGRGGFVTALHQGIDQTSGHVFDYQGEQVIVSLAVSSERCVHGVVDTFPAGFALLQGQ